jgi:hypothetical protein
MDGSDVRYSKRWRWTLWDAATAMQVASGISDGAAFGFDPPVFALDVGDQVELRSTEDGELRGTLPRNSAQQLGLATDGSYLWGISSTALSAWSVTGTPIFSRPGDYSAVDAANVFAGTDELEVVGGPAGPNVVELIATTDGSQRGTIPFEGRFNIWFLDGKHFTTDHNAQDTTFLYDLSGAHVVDALGFTGAVGNFGWRVRSGIFRLDELKVPVVPFDTPRGGVVANGSVIAAFDDPDIQLLHIDVDPPRVEVVHTPIRPAPSLVGLDESGNWAVGNYVRGTESDPLAAAYLGCGPIADIAGTPGGRVAVAVGDRIHAFDAVTGQHQGSLPVAAQKLALMDDGNTLVAQLSDARLQVLTWPDCSVIQTFTAPAGDWFIGWSLASAKGLLSRTVVSTYRLLLYTEEHQITDLSGTTLVDDQARAVSVLSPGGKRVDTAYYDPTPYPCQDGYSGTKFFDAKGRMTGSSPLNVVGWIDENQILTQPWSVCPNAGETRIYDATGNLQATTHSLPSLGSIKPVSATRVYARNAIYDVTTGAVTWSSPLPADPVAGAIAGPKVVFASDGRLHAESY